MGSSEANYYQGREGGLYGQTIDYYQDLRRERRGGGGANLINI